MLILNKYLSSTFIKNIKFTFKKEISKFKSLFGIPLLPLLLHFSITLEVVVGIRVALLALSGLPAHFRLILVVDKSIDLGTLLEIPVTVKIFKFRLKNLHIFFLNCWEHHVITVPLLFTQPSKCVLLVQSLQILLYLPVRISQQLLVYLETPGMGVNQPFKILSIFDFVFVPPANIEEMFLDKFLIPLDEVERIEFLVVSDNVLQKSANPLSVLLFFLHVPIVLKQFPKSLVEENPVDRNGLPVGPPELVL